MALSHCTMNQCLIASLEPKPDVVRAQMTVPVLSLIPMARVTYNDYCYKCINK